MPESEHDASEVIESYRRRRSRWVPLLVSGLAVVLVAVGIFLIVIWLTGANPPSMPAFLASATPTATQTETPVPPTATPTVTMTPTLTSTPTPTGPTTYIVELDDTLWTIAEQFDISIELIIAFNEIEDVNNVPIGTELIIPPPDAELPTATPLPEDLKEGDEIIYTVRLGDTLEAIAARFFTTAEAIAEANDIEDLNTIGIGTELIIKIGPTPTPTATPGPGTPTATPES